MGMAASQARYLSLTARKNNIEYQGQQINQERTILSQQCTDLYNSLLDMKVPTPPSTQDYTKIEYTGSDGATSFTVGLVKPSVAYPGSYNVEIQISATGNFMTKESKKAVVNKNGSVYNTIKIKTKSNTSVPDPDHYTDKGQAPQASYTSGNFMVARSLNTGDPIPSPSFELDNNTNKFIKTSDATAQAGKTYYESKVATTLNPILVDASSPDTHEVEQDKIGAPLPTDSQGNVDISNIYVQDTDGINVRKAVPSDFECDNDGNPIKYAVNVVYYNQSTATDAKEVFDHSSTPRKCLTIEGYEAFELDKVKDDPKYSDYDWDSYIDAIKNKFGSSDSGITAKDFYVYFRQTKTGHTEPCFAFKSDVESPDDRTEVYTYIENGKYTKSEMVDGCGLSFDASGRVTSIDIPSIDEISHEIKSYNTITLTANKITDTAAYNDAYAEYEYNMYKYDKANQEINAKTEIIQQEDKNLELKLTRLDNERKAIDTELDAVKEVIKNNIDKSFKTFSG